MRFNKLEIKGFGKLKDLTIDFKDGLNIIYGNNESGKTSIQWFIKGILFGLKGGRASRDGVLPPLKRYKPWLNEDYSGFIEYKTDKGELYRVQRNFNNNSVRIYDSFFNDITNTFEASRASGALFAERHFGLNETCFEKTVFIRQMESRIDSDGSKELLNRLMNVSQTGFEDVSFNRAQNALKEALKNYVGTGKTTTRPLDRVNARLDILKSQRVELSEKRDSLLDIQSQLNDATKVQSALERKKSFMSALKDIIDIRKSIGKDESIKISLTDFLNSIMDKEEKLQSIQDDIGNFGESIQKLEGFSQYDEKTSDILSSDYFKLTTFLEDNQKMMDEIAKRKSEMTDIERDIEVFRNNDNMEETIEKSILELDRDIELLKIEKGKINIELLNGKIKGLKDRLKGSMYNIAAFAAIGALLLAGSFLNTIVGIISLPAFLLAIILMINRSRLSRELAALEDQKRASEEVLGDITHQVNKKQESLTDIFASLGIENIEGFFRLKAGHESKIQRLISLNNDINRMESILNSNSQRISALTNEIHQKLLSVGLMDTLSLQIKEEHIEEFKNGFNKYKMLANEIGYLTRRSSDINSDLNALYSKASSICGVDCKEEKTLEQLMGDVDKRLNSFKTKLKASIDQLEEQYGKTVLEYSSFKTKAMSLELSEADAVIKDEYNSVCDELSKLLLKIREYETLLGNTADDDEELQKIDEEIAQLEVRKKQLEDINFSLNTALDVLTTASMELQRNFVPLLNSSMSNTISKISGERYNDLRADDNLTLKVVAPETGDVTEVLSLSGGTIDQMYLALRLAMADIIASEGEKLPFVMDETFAQYDDKRTRKALGFLQQLSIERQIIIFTCKEREVDIAKEICGEKLNVITL